MNCGGTAYCRTAGRRSVAANLNACHCQEVRYESRVVGDYSCKHYVKSLSLVCRKVERNVEYGVCDVCICLGKTTANCRALVICCTVGIGYRGAINPSSTTVNRVNECALTTVDHIPTYYPEDVICGLAGTSDGNGMLLGCLVICRKSYTVDAVYMSLLLISSRACVSGCGCAAGG